ncbi:MAG: RNA methyltransferase [Actinomycetaceae bacterium]|nr:RNA methyltransferase [Actinomycetaceae bacterium]
MAPTPAAAPAPSVPGRGVGPWPADLPLPTGDHWDLELLENGDARNVEDHYRYWKMEAIVTDLDEKRGGWFEVAIENLNHDFNIGSIVRTANAFGVRRVHIVGKKRWNRRGAMVTDRYLHVTHHPSVDSFVADVRGRGLQVVGIDNRPGSTALEDARLDRCTVLVMGEESAGLTAEMMQACERVHHITQYGSSRSINVGHAAAVAMWAWTLQHAR